MLAGFITIREGRIHGDPSGHPLPSVINAQIGKPFYQVCVLLSRRNTDFLPGAELYRWQEGRIDLETLGGFGSLILFDGRTYHGVEDIDPDQVIDFSRADGRLARS